MRAKVIWTEPEQDRLFTAIKTLSQQEPGNSIFRLVEKAQLVLDDHRRRNNIKGIDHIPRYLRSRLIANGLLTEASGTVRKADPATLRLEQVANERDGAMAKAELLETQVQTLSSRVKELEHQLAQVPSEVQVIKGFLSDVGADIIRKSRSISNIANAAQLEELQRREAYHRDVGAPVPAKKHDPEPKAAPRDRLPVVLVMGARKHLYSQYESRLHGKVTCRFWTDDNVHLVHDKARTSDYIIVVMGNVSHTALASLTADEMAKVQRTTNHSVESHVDLILNWLKRTVPA